MTDHNLTPEIFGDFGLHLENMRNRKKVETMQIMAIQNNLGQLWDRKNRTWINPEDFSPCALNRRCAYPTFKGCDQAALRFYKKINSNPNQWPKQWGNLHIMVKGA